METIVDNHNQSKCIFEEFSPNGHIYKTLLYLMLRKHSKREGRNIGKISQITYLILKDYLFYN